MRLFWCLIILLISACSPSQRQDGYVHLRLMANPTTLDPALIVDVQSSMIAAKLFNGLVRLGDDLQVIPDLAERWIVSADGRRYRFHLRRDVRFPDGRPVVADDVRYSFERVLSPKTKSPNTWIFQQVEGGEAYRSGGAAGVAGFRILDSHTFEITLKQPFSPFLRMLTMPPAFVVQREDVERKGPEFGHAPSGTGPFVLSRWMPGHEIVLGRNPEYFDNTAKVAGIVYRVIPEDLTALTEFELGNLDVVALPASAYAKFMNDPKWQNRIMVFHGMNTYYLGMNCSRPPFDDPGMRRAVSQAIDREKILRTFYEGRGRLARGPVPDLLRAWQPASPYAYDPAAAKNQIRLLGAEGMTVSLYVTADQEVVDIAEIIQAALKRAGLRVEIRQLEWSAYKDAINRGQADLFWLSWWADYPDAEHFLFPLFHSANHGPQGNRARYTNAAVDRLIAAGQGAVTESQRSAAYRAAETLIVQDAPWVFLWHKNDYHVLQPWILGYRERPIYSMDKGLDIELVVPGKQ